MEPDDLPDAEDLWWSWVVLAAMHRTVGDKSCRFEPDQVVLALDSADGSWLRMQRPHGRRSVLWGRSTLAPESPPDARRGAPDGALTEATEERCPTFVAWHAHGEWDLSAPYDEGAIHLLRPLLTVDPRAVELVRSGEATPEALASYADGEHLEEAVELVRQAGSEGPSSARGLVASRLRDQIHGQMRDSTETERMLMGRPPALVQWSRINGPGGAGPPPGLAGFVLDAFAGTIEVAAVDEDLDRLTEREREVMRLIARGYSYKEVGSELFISIKTVETHMSSVLRKLQLSSRHELTRWASDRRLL